MIISVLGTGRVASAIGHGLVKAGHELVFGSRTGTASGLPGRVTTLSDAAAIGEVILNATPGATTLETLKAIGGGPLGSKVLVDVSNAISAGFLLAYPNTSLASTIQDGFPDLSVVKTLNTVHAQVMAAPEKFDRPITGLPVRQQHGRQGNRVRTARRPRLVPGVTGRPRRHRNSRATEDYIFMSFALTRATGSTHWNLSLVQ